MNYFELIEDAGWQGYIPVILCLCSVIFAAISIKKPGTPIYISGFSASIAVSWMVTMMSADTGLGITVEDLAAAGYTVFIIGGAITLICAVITGITSEKETGKETASSTVIEKRFGFPGSKVTDGKTCPNCGEKLSKTAVFCGVCGFNLADVKESSGRVCIHCGKPLKNDAVFCPFCGGKQGEDYTPVYTAPSSEKDVYTSATVKTSHPADVTKYGDVPFSSSSDKGFHTVSDLRDPKTSYAVPENDKKDYVPPKLKTSFPHSNGRRDA